MAPWNKRLKLDTNPGVEEHRIVADSAVTDLEGIPEALAQDNHTQLAAGQVVHNVVERDEPWMHLAMTRSPVEL
jgi:hypothetical protein